MHTSKRSNYLQVRESVILVKFTILFYGDYFLFFKLSGCLYKSKEAIGSFISRWSASKMYSEIETMYFKIRIILWRYAVLISLFDHVSNALKVSYNTYYISDYPRNPSIYMYYVCTYKLTSIRYTPSQVLKVILFKEWIQELHVPKLYENNMGWCIMRFINHEAFYE